MSSDRVSKFRAKTKSASSIRRNDLLSVILSNPDLATMPSCSYCKEKGREQCQASPLDSDRCVWCVRDNQSRCDILGVSPSQLRSIADRHSRLERELEEAEERALAEQQKVQRLRKQKKLWFEKMMRAISRGIDNVEDLERVEREEAEKERQSTERSSSSSSPSFDLPPGFVESWDTSYDNMPLSPSTLDMLGMINGSVAPVDKPS